MEPTEDNDGPAEDNDGAKRSNSLECMHTTPRPYAIM